MENKYTLKYTYIQRRKCLFCNTPIPDQIHAGRKYCVTILMEDGCVKSCHDDYHIKINKQKNKQYKGIMDLHKKQHRNIEKLFKKKGETVTSEQLDQYDIHLNCPVEIRKLDGLFNYFFVEYVIISINNQQYKIAKHERKF